MTREEILGKKGLLEQADLSFTNLRDANLRCANLTGADLRGADLRGADLRGANLTGANLRGADLTDADLTGANLRGADLRDANLDYSCITLSCKTLSMKVDKRIASQIAYHFCRLICDDPDFLKTKEKVIDFANNFHRVDECGILEHTEQEIIDDIKKLSAVPDINFKDTFF